MFSFEEQFIPDEKERLISFLEQYAKFLARLATPTTLKNYQLISTLLQNNSAHAEILVQIQSIFATEDGKPKRLILSSETENILGPNRSAEYLGLHADICYMVTQNLN